MAPRRPTLLDRERTAHRPWPCPARPWAMAMGWHDLAFLHWPVAPESLRPHLPPALTLDTHDGQAWLGVVPFRMSGVRPRRLPALPGISAFPEINLRTYATAGGKPGVWFFSLDVTRRLAVHMARTFFHLPYFHARMEVRAEGEGVHYTHRRTHRRAPAVAFEASYAPCGALQPAVPGSFDAWLTERYCLYSADSRGRLFRGEVHHDPWPLQPAEVELRRSTLFEQLGLDPPAGAPVAHFARDLSVVAWALEPVFDRGAAEPDAGGLPPAVG